MNQFLEEHIAEGDELRGGLDAEQTADTRSRCKILQVSLFEGPLAPYGVCLFGSVVNVERNCLKIIPLRIKISKADLHNMQKEI